MSVWLCSGQGAQKPSMGKDLLVLGEVAHTFATMSKIIGIDLVKLTEDGTQDEINQPEAAQALTMAVSVGVGRALSARGYHPDAVIGFSLGQISALVLTDILSLEDATRLLKVRSTAMAKACEEVEGGMVALMGASLDEATELCAEAANGEVLVCANHNAPGQIVISGQTAALERAQQLWKDRGKRSKMLATAGAFHSPLMANAADEVRAFCTTLTFQEPAVTLVCNTDAKPFVVAEAAERLGRQVESGVLFEQSVRAMIDAGETEFIEVGFGGVLTNLVKRIDADTTRHPIGTFDQFSAFVG